MEKYSVISVSYFYLFDFQSLREKKTHNLICTSNLSYADNLSSFVLYQNQILGKTISILHLII